MTFSFRLTTFSFRLRPRDSLLFYLPRLSAENKATRTREGEESSLPAPLLWIKQQERAFQKGGGSQGRGS